MPKKQLSSEKISKPSGHFSQATVTEARGRLVFISGMTARRSDGTIAGIGDIEAQTHQVCQNVKAAVEAAGGTMDNLVKMTVYVVDIKNNTEVWRARREFFSGDFPASTLVEVRSLAGAEVLVEIEAVAYLGRS